MASCQLTVPIPHPLFKARLTIPLLPLISGEESTFNLYLTPELQAQTALLVSFKFHLNLTHKLNFSSYAPQITPTDTPCQLDLFLCCSTSCQPCSLKSQAFHSSTPQRGPPGLHPHSAQGWTCSKALRVPRFLGT